VTAELSTNRPAYGAIPRNLLRDPSIDTTAKAIWAVLDDYASPDSPKPWPSITTIAGHLGIAENTVRDRLRQLSDRGHLHIQERRGPKGERLSNRYTMDWFWPVPGGGGTSPGEGGGTSPGEGEEEPLQEEPEKLLLVNRSTTTRPAATNNPPSPQRGASSKKRRKPNAAEILAPIDAHAFAEWWIHYPVKKRRADAMRAWANAMEAGITADRLETALQHYLASIDDWEARAGQKQTYLFAAPRFIDEGYLEFEDGPDPDRWPLPAQSGYEVEETSAWEQPTWSGEPDDDGWSPYDD